MLHGNYVEYLYFNVPINVPDNLISANGREDVKDDGVNEQKPFVGYRISS